MKKTFLLSLFIVFVIAGCAKTSGQPITPAQNNKPSVEQPRVSNDRDDHDCIDGYIWCEIKQKCLPMWGGEGCVSATTSPSNLMVPPTDLSITDNPSTDNKTEEPKVYACQEDAKICPDGTVVGRTGPKCEFTACPSSTCSCPDGFYLEGDICNPECYKSRPSCLRPSIACTPKKECGTCPMLSQPAPGFCTDGAIVDGGKDECGCQTPPKCEKNTQGGSTGLANPAAVYCEEQGGKSEIITKDDGSQSGNCILSNGNVCDEWQYFRGECK